MFEAGDNRRTALIVEERSGIAELGAAMLAEFDLDVEFAPSAETAIDHLCRRGGQIDVVLSGVRPPGRMTGAALARRISVLWPTVSVILMSDEPGQEPASLPARAAVIPKPWLPLNVVAATERAWRADHTVKAVRL